MRFYGLGIFDLMEEKEGAQVKDLFARYCGIHVVDGPRCLLIEIVGVAKALLISAMSDSIAHRVQLSNTLPWIG